MTRGIRLVGLTLVSATAALALATAPSAQAKASGTKFPYVFINAGGSKTIIPSEPTRVVDINGVDGILSLGAHVVGALPQEEKAPAVGGGNAQGQPAWLNGGELEGIASIGGTDGDPDYEQIAALRPDLIIVEGAAGSEWAQLSAIAPTIEPPGSNRNGAYPAGLFGFDYVMLELAPLFNATAHVDQMIARMRERSAALAPFVRGTSVAIIIPVGGIFYLDAEVGNTGGFFEMAGATLENSTVAGAFSTSGGNLYSASDELLPEVSASKVLVLSDWNTQSEASFKADPLYPEIPAVKTGQIYFTGWDFAGPVGEVDYAAQFSKEMFGVTPLEAILAGAGRRGSDRSGVADVDVGPTEKRVCWDISTSGNVKRPTSAVVVDKRGKRLFALGGRYASIGCANISFASGRSLVRSPGRYRVSIDAAHTPEILLGSLAQDSPAFFGNGHDRPYTQ